MFGFFKKSKKPIPKLQEKITYSFTNDSKLTFNNPNETIPEIRDALHRLNNDKQITMEDLSTYFKFFERGYQLHSAAFTIKKEFFENALFVIDSANLEVDDNKAITGINLIVKEELTGLQIYIQAPTSFFREFATSVKFKNIAKV